MHAIVEATKLTKEYPLDGGAVRALSEVNLALQPGEFVALVGPSGCGKSSLLNILGFADTPTSGEVSIAGEKIDYTNQHHLMHVRREKVGYVFQQFFLLPMLRANENILLSLRLAGWEREAAIVRTEELLHRVGLTRRADHFPSALSGGEKQRVAVCRAIAPCPQYLLADEPTGNLDSVAGESVLMLLRDITKEGTTVLMATHSLEAQQWCSRVVRLHDGEVVG